MNTLYIYQLTSIADQEDIALNEAGDVLLHTDGETINLQVTTSAPMNKKVLTVLYCYNGQSK